MSTRLFKDVSDVSDDDLTIYESDGAVTWGDPWRDEVWVVTVDEEGDSYVTGLTRVTSADDDVFLRKYGPCNADFAPDDPACGEDPDPHTSNGSRDIFMSAFLADGCW